MLNLKYKTHQPILADWLALCLKFYDGSGYMDIAHKVMEWTVGLRWF